jgi:putative ABC transport system substrate-binding protein
MKRREFITLLAGAAAWPVAARAQQPERMRRVGVLLSQAETDPAAQAQLPAFRDALARLGWTVGRRAMRDFG